MGIWVFVSANSYGQLIIDTSNSPAEWSSSGTLTNLEIIQAETSGIEIKNGGVLLISNSTLTNISKDIVIESGGNLTVLSDLNVSGELNVSGTCSISAITKVLGTTSTTGQKVLIGSTANLGLSGILEVSVGISEFIVEQGANIMMSNATFECRSPSSIIEGDVDIDASLVYFYEDVEFAKNGKLTLTNTIKLGFAKDVTLSNTYEVECNNSILEFNGNMVLGGSNVISCSNSSTLKFGTFNKSVVLHGTVNVSNSTSDMRASIIDLYGTINIIESNFKLCLKLIMLESSLLKATNSFINVGNDAEIMLSASCGNRIDAENTTFQPVNAGATWKGISSEVNSKCNTLSSQFIVAPQIDGSGNCTEEDWNGILNKQVSQVQLNLCNLINAEVAISADGKAFLNNSVPSRGATIIRVRETTFTNCNKGILIKDYSNSNGDPNASYIMTCNFETNDAFPPSFLKQYLVHIELDNLAESGVNIGGCIFTNSMTTQEANLDRGTGIKIIESSASIAHDGDRCKLVEGDECPDNSFADPNQSRNNEFHNLSYGIKVDQNSNADYSASIRFSDFFDCYRSIDVKDAENTPINEDSFTLTQSTYSSFFTNPNPGDRYFINLEESGGYTIADCKMYANLDVAADELTYIQATNATGLPVYNSKIKNNEFHNNNAIGVSNGIVLQDHSRGNDITCNTFNNLTTDIWVKGSSSMNHLEAIPKSDKEPSWNKHPMSSNTNFVANVQSDIALNVHVKTNSPLPLITIGAINIPTHPSAQENCVFICEDNENTTTASDDEVLGVLKIAGNTRLWIYEENVNSIAFGTSDKKVYDICIYNLFGQCGVELENVHPKTSIDVSSLASGIYFVFLRDSEGIETTLRFIKK